MLNSIRIFPLVFTALLVMSVQASANSAAQDLFRQLNVKVAGKAAMTDNKFVAYLTADKSNTPLMVFEIHPNANVNSTGSIQKTVARVDFSSKTPCFKAKLARNAFKGKMAYFNGAKVNACNQIGRKEGERYIAVKARKDKGWRLGLLR